MMKFTGFRINDSRSSEWCRWSIRFLVVGALLTILTPQYLHAQDALQRARNFHRDVKQKIRAGFSKPKTGRSDAMERLAEEIDWLENYMDQYGSVVVKQPDVWGESRLTKFRREIEGELAARLDDFVLRDNARVIRSDIANLAAALSIGAATDSQSATAGTITSVTGSTTTTSGAMGGAGGMGGMTETAPPPPVSIEFRNLTPPASPEALSAGSSLEPVIELNQLNRYLNHLTQLRRINEGDDTSDAPGYALNLVRIPVSILPGRATRRGYGAEVTISANPYNSENLLPSTFRNLVINDLVDKLSLPVVRLAEAGEAARNISRFLTDPANAEISRLLGIEIGRLRSRLSDENDPVTEQDLQLFVMGSIPGDGAFETDWVLLNDFGLRFRALLETNRQLDAANSTLETLTILRTLLGQQPDPETSAKEDVIKTRLRLSQQQLSQQDFSNRVQQLNQRLESFLEQTSRISDILNEALPQPQIGSGFLASGSRRLPVPPQILHRVFSREVLDEVALKLEQRYNGRHTVWNETSSYPNQIHLPDARHFLNANFSAAYDALATEAGCILLVQAIEDGNLAQLIQAGKIPQISSVRTHFFNGLNGLQIDSGIACYCWCIAVEMATLNKRLNEDVRESATARGDCGCDPGKYCKFYLPKLHAGLAGQNGYSGLFDLDFTEAANQFCEYVNCRWPIHVFTIDPINQEQNVSEASVVQRELAIAAALSFASGNINLNQLTQFQRQFQEEIATVALNRTQVGFAHSNDTFGWRFSPRIQSRTPQGNLRAFGETLFGRGADAMMREASLEPGIRECTAIVLMPSFVPYCDFDVRTNWYRLDKPTHSDVSMKETLKLSRSVTAMRNSKNQCLQCASVYRDGEIGRLLRRVEQLEREIPLQSLRTQVPYENTAGGFDLFNNGLTDLAPELVGWYGAPGIRLRRPGTPSSSPAAPSTSNAASQTNTTTTTTTIIVNGETPQSTTPASAPASSAASSGTTVFLVGNNFSVHETQIVAGGIPIAEPNLISRQVMQVFIPDTANTVTINENGVDKTFVAVYAATPYGVTSHLHIPVIRDPATQAQQSLAALQTRVERLEEPEFQWQNPAAMNIEIGFTRNGAMCNADGIRPTNPIARWTLAASPVARLGLENKSIAIIGRLRNPATNALVGGPFNLVTVANVNSGAISVTAGGLFASDELRNALAGVSSTDFNTQNRLTLRLETFIRVDDDQDSYRRANRINGDIDLQLISVSCTSSNGQASGNSGGTTGNNSGSDSKNGIVREAPSFEPSNGSTNRSDRDQ